MILLVLTGLLFAGLLAAAALKIKQKVVVLGGCVILLVLCNLANEIAAAHAPLPPKRHARREDRQAGREIAPASVAALTNESAEERAGDLLEEEREMVGYLWKRWEGREHTLVHFENLHRNRLKLVLEVANHRINHTDPQRNFLPYHLDFKQRDCDARCLQAAVEAVPREAYLVLIVENVKHSGQLSDLQAIYSNRNVTIIFQSIPRFFPLHTISRLTYRYPFSNNYLPKILEQHPSKTIEHCSLYRSFDYNFYAASLSVPLLELCSRALPTTPAVRCVKQYLSEEKARVPESWVRRCLLEEGQEGLVVEEGWIGVRKEYFWSGRVNRTELLPEKEDL